jgi:hypothetical protein
MEEWGMADRDRIRRNAEELETGLGARVPAAEESPSEAAVQHVRSYLRLLREAASDETAVRNGRRFSFKLQLDDGRWNVDEKVLAVPPRAGDVVSFADGRRWQVFSSQTVRSRPAGKQPREIFVCAPVA